jgi:hypothetical protein
VRVVLGIGGEAHFATESDEARRRRTVEELVRTNLESLPRARTDVLVTGNRYEAVGGLRSSEDSDGTPTPAPRSP